MHLPLALAVAGPSIRTQQRPLVAAASFAVLRVGVDLARPWPLALAIDYAIDDRARDGLPTVLQGLSPTALLVVAAIAVLGLTAISGVLDMATTMWSEQAAERIDANLRGLVFERAMDLSLRWHDRVRRGELLSRLTTDVGRMLDAIVASLTMLVPDVVMLVGVLVVLLTINVELVFVGLAVVPLLAILSPVTPRPNSKPAGHGSLRRRHRQLWGVDGGAGVRSRIARGGPARAGGTARYGRATARRCGAAHVAA